MRAFRVRVFGRVQRVGYRRFVIDEAQGLGLAGYVRNLPDGSVEVFAQGGEEELERFLEAVERPPLGEVKRIEVGEAVVDPEVEGFRIIYGELGDELQEGFGGMQEVFMQYWGEFRDYREEFREFARRTDENFRILMEKYGEISERMADILETLVEESKRTRELFMKESRETHEMINESLRLLREAIDRLR